MTHCIICKHYQYVPIVEKLQVNIRLSAFSIQPIALEPQLGAEW
jgi:hypothetical protein